VWRSLGDTLTGLQTTGRQNFGLGLGPVLDLEVVIFVAQLTVTRLVCRPGARFTKNPKFLPSFS